MPPRHDQPRARNGRFAAGRGNTPIGQPTDLDDLAPYLPDTTVAAWRKLAPVIPPWAYLAGGTALATHLHHRVSRDLDFFTERPFDPDDTLTRFRTAGTFAVSRMDAGTLNGTFEGAKTQFLDASSQHHIEPPTWCAGIRVASVPDLMAMKLKVLADRGELRDYYDLMRIEQDAGLAVEDGLSLVLARYTVEGPDAVIASIVRAIGYLGDVVPDPSLPIRFEQVESYWVSRHAAIVASAARTWL